MVGWSSSGGLGVEANFKLIEKCFIYFIYARYDRWWGGAVQVGPEQDGNWIWIESGAPVQKWAWGRLYTGSRRNDTNNFVFQFFQYVDK